MSESIQQLFCLQAQRLWPELVALAALSVRNASEQQQLLRCLHTLKGSALAVDQRALAESCHEAESALQDTSLTDDFARHWPQLQAQWLPVLSRPAQALVGVDELQQAVQQFFTQTAQQLGQQARLHSEISPLWLAEQDLFWDVVPHLLRNALSHGYSPPEQRLAANKPALQQVVLRARVRRAGAAPAYQLVVADDGAGVARSVATATLWQGRGQGVAAVRAALLRRAQQLGYQARLRWRGRANIGAVVRLSLKS